MSDHVTADPVQRSEPLVRRLTLPALWLLVINGMIGAGIFGVPAAAEQLAGRFSPWVFAICALLIAPVMLCFAQLASAFRGTGGPTLYARTAFGPFAGFQIGWAFYIARLTAFAANTNLLVTTVAFFWPEAIGPALRVGLILLVCGLLTWVNLVGAQTAMRALGVITVLKLLPLVGLALVGLVGLDQTVFTSAVSPPGLVDLSAAVLLVIYAYVGFESGLVPGGESRNPQRDMPRALLLALAIAATVYVLVQFATQRLVPDLAMAERPVVDAGAALFGQVGAVVVVLAIIASVGGNLLGSMFSTSRISYRLALDGQLPPFFASVHPRYATPWLSVLVFGGTAFVLAATGSFVWLAVISVFVRLLIYGTCIAAMPRVNAAAEESPDRIRLPGGLAIPALGMLVCAGLATQVSLASLLATVGLLAVGTLLFMLAAWQRRVPGNEAGTHPRTGES